MIKKFITTLWGQPNKGIHGESEADPGDLTVDNAYKTRRIRS